MKFNNYILHNICQLSLIAFLSCTLTHTTNGQTQTKQNALDIEIYGGQNGNLYTNGSNLISIKTKDTASIFTVKSSQGVVWQLDKYMFFVDSLQKGRTTLTIFKIRLGKNLPVKTINYNVLVSKLLTKYNSLSIPPDISLGGFTNGKVKLDTLKKITALSINENYTMLSAIFYIGIVDLLSKTIQSKYFDNDLKAIWQRIGPNCIISIDNIEFMDKSGNRFFYPKIIKVVAEK